jgi:hypothetical protein
MHIRLLLRQVCYAGQSMWSVDASASSLNAEESSMPSRLPALLQLVGRKFLITIMVSNVELKYQDNE